MLTHTIKQGKKKEKINIPQSYEEVNWGMYKKLPERATKDNQNEILEVLSSKSFEDYWAKLTDVEGFLDIRLQCLETYLQNIDLESYPLWDIIEYKGKAYNLDKDLADLTIMLWEEASVFVKVLQLRQAEVDERNKPQVLDWKLENADLIKGMDDSQVHTLMTNELELEALPVRFFNETVESVFKVFFYEAFTGNKYNADETQAMDIDGLYCLDVLKWGTFFLRNTAAYLNGIMPIAGNRGIPVKKARQGILRYLISLGFLRRYSHWRRGI